VWLHRIRVEERPELGHHVLPINVPVVPSQEQPQQAIREDERATQQRPRFFLRVRFKAGKRQGCRARVVWVMNAQCIKERRRDISSPRVETLDHDAIADVSPRTSWML